MIISFVAKKISYYYIHDLFLFLAPQLDDDDDEEKFAEFFENNFHGFQFELDF